MPLISVIVPVYKVEQYLSRCIESILCQTFINFELILVDDGSPDSCPDICDQFARTDSRIKVIHQKNSGLSAARNAGLGIAQGDYYCFIDSDDYVKDVFLEKLYQSLIDNNADLSMCNFICVDELGNYIPDNAGCKNFDMDLVLQETDFWEKYYEGYVICTISCSKLYKKQLFKDVSYKVGVVNEDVFILHHIICQCQKIAICADELYYYYRRSDSITGNQKRNPSFFILQALIERQKYFDRKGFSVFSEKNARAMYGELNKNRLMFNEILKGYKADINTTNNRLIKNFSIIGKVDNFLFKHAIWLYGCLHSSKLVKKIIHKK